mmetsp:Transcript_17853/g.39954  ORF Transcript_17853/g.39954 Transcript_17853/m.39954 type:complete len:285 (-) Transcript_17853:349-1203(-)
MGRYTELEGARVVECAYCMRVRDIGVLARGARARRGWPACVVDKRRTTSRAQTPLWGCRSIAGCGRWWYSRRQDAEWAGEGGGLMDEGPAYCHSASSTAVSAVLSVREVSNRSSISSILSSEPMRFIDLITGELWGEKPARSSPGAGGMSAGGIAVFWSTGSVGAVLLGALACIDAWIDGAMNATSEEVAWKHCTFPRESRSGSTRSLCEKALPVRVWLTIESAIGSPPRMAPISCSRDVRVVSGPWISSSVWPSTCGMAYSHSWSHASDAHTIWNGSSPLVIT